MARATLVSLYSLPSGALFRWQGHEYRLWTTRQKPEDGCTALDHTDWRMYHFDSNTPVEHIHE